MSSFFAAKWIGVSPSLVQNTETILKQILRATIKYLSIKYKNVTH